MTGRTRGLLAIAVAAGASIATSPPRWYLEKHAELAPATLDPQTRTVRYVIHNEIRGNGPFEYLGGDMTISFSFSPPPPMGVQLMLNGVTHPEEQSSSGTLGLGVDSQYVTTWLACPAECNEYFEIVLTLPETDTTSSIQITGTVDVNVHGNDSDSPPDGTELVTTIEGPLP